MEELSTLAHGRFGDLKIIVHYTMVATAEDWSAFMKDALEMPTVQGLLVVAGGAKLEADQRTDIRSLYDKHKMKIAVLTDSRVTRGVITALGWFGVSVRGFPTGNLRELLEYLERSSHYGEISTALEPFIQRSYDESNTNMKFPTR